FELFDKRLRPAGRLEELRKRGRELGLVEAVGDAVREPAPHRLPGGAAPSVSGGEGVRRQRGDGAGPPPRGERGRAVDETAALLLMNQPSEVPRGGQVEMTGTGHGGSVVEGVFQISTAGSICSLAEDRTGPGADRVGRRGAARSQPAER